MTDRWARGPRGRKRLATDRTARYTYRYILRPPTVVLKYCNHHSPNEVIGDSGLLVSRQTQRARTAASCCGHVYNVLRLRRHATLQHRTLRCEQHRYAQVIKLSAVPTLLLQLLASGVILLWSVNVTHLIHTCMTYLLMYVRVQSWHRRGNDFSFRGSKNWWKTNKTIKFKI